MVMRCGFLWLWYGLFFTIHFSGFITLCFCYASAFFGIDSMLLIYGKRWPSKSSKTSIMLGTIQPIDRHIHSGSKKTKLIVENYTETRTLCAKWTFFLVKPDFEWFTYHLFSFNGSSSTKLPLISYSSKKCYYVVEMFIRSKLRGDCWFSTDILFTRFYTYKLRYFQLLSHAFIFLECISQYKIHRDYQWLI